MHPFDLPVLPEDQLPVVTQEEFNQIECNRCGECCEGLHFQSPLRNIFIYGGEQSYIVRFLRERNKGFNDYDLVEAGWKPDEVKRCIANLDWFEHLEAMGPNIETDDPTGNNQRYRCTYFKRQESDGLGFCTIHERRPNICRNYPYGNPVVTDDLPHCSYRVKIA